MTTRRVPRVLALCVLCACGGDAGDRPVPPSGGAGGGAAGQGVAGGPAGAGGGGTSGSGGGAVVDAGAGSTVTDAAAGGRSAGVDAAVDSAAPRFAVPMVDGSKVRLASGALAIVIDAQVGARVTEVGLAGVNLLTGPAVNQENWGSTFWPSPQGVWKDRWPPPPEIDNRPYTTTVTPDAVAFAGNRNDMLKLRANKTFALDSQAESIDITYQLLTDETAGVMAAPWEVTRLPCRGLVFFGVGAGARLDPLLVREGAAWLDLSALAAAPPKVVTDGTGWMAWVDAPSRTLFVKAYPDVAPAAFAPEESDTELFVADTKTYIELEAQGPYQKITPAAPVSWAVRWWVRRVPAGIDLTVGSAALVAYVHQTIGK